MNWYKNYEIEILYIEDTKLASAVNEKFIHLVGLSEGKDHLDKNA